MRVQIDGDRICFLSSERECLDLDDYIGRVCVYTCIWIGSSAEPTRKGEAGAR